MNNINDLKFGQDLALERQPNNEGLANYYKEEIRNEQIKVLAELMERQQIERLYLQNCACQANIDNVKAKIKEGKKYTKIDLGGSGKLMIDQDGNIFGIKAYGVINKKHFYGTLETINDFYWGGYRPKKK